MGRLVVSVLDGSGARQFSAEFPTSKTAKDFVEWRIEELLDQGAPIRRPSRGRAASQSEGL